MTRERVKKKPNAFFSFLKMCMTDEMIRFWYVEIDSKSKISM